MTNFKIVIQVIKDFKIGEAQEAGDLQMSFVDAEPMLKRNKTTPSGTVDEEQRRMDQMMSEMSMGGNRVDDGKSYMVQKNKN